MTLLKNLEEENFLEDVDLEALADNFEAKAEKLDTPDSEVGELVAGHSWEAVVELLLKLVAVVENGLPEPGKTADAAVDDTEAESELPHHILLDYVDKTGGHQTQQSDLVQEQEKYIGANAENGKDLKLQDMLQHADIQEHKVVDENLKDLRKSEI